MRSFMMPALMALSIGLFAVPAHAFDRSAGEIRTAVSAGAQFDQVRQPTTSSAASSPTSRRMSNGTARRVARLGIYGLIALILGALRMARRVWRASRFIARLTGSGRAKVVTEPPRPVFDDRLAKQLRALDRLGPEDAANPSAPRQGIAAAPPYQPAMPHPIHGPRTFGRRVA